MKNIKINTFRKNCLIIFFLAFLFSYIDGEKKVLSKYFNTNKVEVKKYV